MCVHVNVHICVYICKCVCLYTCESAGLCIHMQACVLIYMYIYVYTFVYVYVWGCLLEKDLFCILSVSKHAVHLILEFHD